MVTAFGSDLFKLLLDGKIRSRLDLDFKLVFLDLDQFFRMILDIWFRSTSDTNIAHHQWRCKRKCTHFVMKKYDCIVMSEQLKT